MSAEILAIRSGPRLRCAATTSGGSRRSQLSRETSTNCAALNISRKTRSGVAGIFDVMPRNPWHEAHIIGSEVHRARPSFVHDDGHAPFTGDPVLPFARVGMPVQFAEGSGFERDQCSGDVGARGEVAGVDDANLASRGSPGGWHRRKRECVLDGRLDPAASNCCSVLTHSPRTASVWTQSSGDRSGETARRRAARCPGQMQPLRQRKLPRTSPGVTNTSLSPSRAPPNQNVEFSSSIGQISPLIR